MNLLTGALNYQVQKVHSLSSSLKLIQKWNLEMDGVLARDRRMGYRMTGVVTEGERCGLNIHFSTFGIKKPFKFQYIFVSFT